MSLGASEASGVEVPCCPSKGEAAFSKGCPQPSWPFTWGEGLESSPARGCHRSSLYTPTHPQTFLLSVLLPAPPDGSFAGGHLSTSAPGVTEEHR